MARYGQYAMAKANNFKMSIDDMYFFLYKNKPDKLIKLEDIQLVRSKGTRNQGEDLLNLDMIGCILKNPLNEEFKAEADLYRFFPNLLFIFNFVNLTDYKWVIRAQQVIQRQIKVERQFYLEETIFEEFLTPNTQFNFKWRVLKNDFSLDKVKYFKYINSSILFPRINKSFKIMMMIDEPIDIGQLLLNDEYPIMDKTKDSFKRVILHFHGGGYFSMSPASHRGYLSEFVSESNCTVFSVDYTLAPFSEYPGILEESFKSYLFVIVR